MKRECDMCGRPAGKCGLCRGCQAGLDDLEAAIVAQEKREAAERPKDLFSWTMDELVARYNARRTPSNMTDLEDVWRFNPAPIEP